jgi:hypothetical protein
LSNEDQNSIDVSDDFGANPQKPAPLQPAPATSITNAANQAVPGVNPPSNKGPHNVSLPSVVSRTQVVSNQPSGVDVLIDLSSEASFEQNLGRLIVKDLELAKHDRALAVSLFQVHLERGEVLDGMALSMPVAQVISDNTGATLKALELAMKAGERLHKTAELLVSAQKNADTASLNALKMKIAKEADRDSWGSDSP